MKCDIIIDINLFQKVCLYCCKLSSLNNQMSVVLQKQAIRCPISIASALELYFFYFIFLGELILPDWGTTVQEGQYTNDPSNNETVTDQVTVILHYCKFFCL